MLASLQKEILAQEELEEREEIESEGKEEKRIRDELEAEEDERDRTQEGGRNPKIGFDFANYNFTTGRFPRRVSTRGDCSYRTDGSSLTYLKIFKEAILMIATPFRDGNCGGRRLNQYTVTLELMYSPPTKKTADGLSAGIERPPQGFGVLAEDDPFAEFGVAASTASLDNSLRPIFSTAAYGETEALLYTNSQGKLVASIGSSSAVKGSLGNSTSSFQSSSSLSSGKWSILTIVVDCVEGTVDLYVNGRSFGQAKMKAGSGESNIDGNWSMGDQFSLFATKIASQCGDNSLRNVFLQTRCLLGSEVIDLADELKREGQSGIVNEIVVQLMSMGFSADISRWAAMQSEGQSVEDRLNSALSLLS